MLGTDAERERDVEEPTALCRPPWPYVRLRYSWVDNCRRPEEDDRALLLRPELERTELPAALRPDELRVTWPRGAELRPALLRPEYIRRPLEPRPE